VAVEVEELQPCDCKTKQCAAEDHVCHEEALASVDGKSRAWN